MFSELNASTYKYSSVYYNAEFEYILSKIVACYLLMLKEKVGVCDDENKIRDIIVNNYLKKRYYKQLFNLTNYLFDSETPENKGRIDIRIMPINPFKDDEAYYIIECKRLDASNPMGTSGLNGEYISEGICRFTSSKYSCYYKTNGMIAFIVQPINIQENIDCLNYIIKTSSFPSHTIQNIQQRKIVNHFDYSYYSIHRVNNSKITIYHLMLDFSKNIKK